MREEIGSPLPPKDRPDYDRRVVAARAALGNDAAFDRARQEGSALKLEQAIALALEETSAPRRRAKAPSTMLEIRLALVDKGAHPFLLIVQCKRRVKLAPLEQQAICQ